MAQETELKSPKGNSVCPQLRLVTFDDAGFVKETKELVPYQ